MLGPPASSCLPGGPGGPVKPRSPWKEKQGMIMMTIGTKPEKMPSGKWGTEFDSYACLYYFVNQFQVMFNSKKHTN